MVILDSGGYGYTVADVAEQFGYNILFLDDSLPGHELSRFSSYLDDYTEFIPAFRNNAFRLEWLTRLESAGGKLATLVHPTAQASPRSTINPGTDILPHAIINTDVVINRGCTINLGAVIDHGCIIEKGTHVCLGAIVNDENYLPRCIKTKAGEVVDRDQYPF